VDRYLARAEVAVHDNSSAAGGRRRAARVHRISLAALADRDIRAVIASIGGEDERKVPAFIDPDVPSASPAGRSRWRTEPVKGTPG